jgi:hypothetical protein
MLASTQQTLYQTKHITKHTYYKLLIKFTQNKLKDWSDLIYTKQTKFVDPTISYRI